MTIPLHTDVVFILETLQNAGHMACVVGGCVRDSLMGVTPKDWDIATSAVPHEIKALFPRSIDTGIEHGTVTVVQNGINYEVTTFRIDGEYLDGRRPEEVTFTKDLTEDLSRRDFTMNAIAYSPANGLADPFNGISDINKKIIRCVGHAPDRFSEDALRMMRAIRFCAQLSFDIDRSTYSAIPPLASRLGMVSIERIRDELTKILSAQNPNALTLLEDLGLWPFILRGTPFKGVLSQAASLLKACPKEPALLYALLPADENFMRHLKFDNHTIKETAIYTFWLKKCISNDRYHIKTILKEIGPNLFNNLLTLKEIILPKEAAGFQNIRLTVLDILNSGECFTLKDLEVKGSDLIAAGIPPGKNIGRILDGLLDAVMRGEIENKKDSLLCQYVAYDI